MLTFEFPDPGKADYFVARLQRERHEYTKSPSGKVVDVSLPASDDPSVTAITHDYLVMLAAHFGAYDTPKATERAPERPRYFEIAGMVPPVEGVDLGGRWNGWRRPAFPKASAEAIADAHNEYYEAEAEGDATGPGPGGAYAWYDEASRAYFFHTPPSGETDKYRVGATVDGIDHWTIGTDSWTWETVPHCRVTIEIDVLGPEADDLDGFVDTMLDEGILQDALTEDAGADGSTWRVTNAQCRTEEI